MLNGIQVKKLTELNLTSYLQKKKMLHYLIICVNDNIILHHLLIKLYFTGVNENNTIESKEHCWHFFPTRLNKERSKESY